FGHIKIAILENSQAVTAFDLEAESKRMFDAGADFLILGEPYFNWDEISTFVVEAGDVPDNVKTPETSTAIRRHYDKHFIYPTPAWDLFPVENYWSLPYSHGPKLARKYLPTLTSRGCPWPCDFCVVPKTNDRLWRGRSPEKIVDEIIELRDRFGVYHFQLEDLNPTVNWPRFAAFCEALIKQQAGITFSIVSGTKAETIALDAVPLLAQAGCRYLSISPESGSETLMRVIGKTFNYDYAAQLVELCHRHKVRTQACFLVGHPSETESDFVASRDYMRHLLRRGLDEVAIFIVSPFAGSSLYQESKIALSDAGVQPTFGPKGRVDHNLYRRRRAIMMRLFFIEKLKRGMDLWIQGVRSLFLHPQTKMENLPKRVLFVLKGVFVAKLRMVFSRQKI
ncbi:radical SAM protein, partial [Alphaproteobacteria bacterium]|nr:radical SAM protein [Alphaproteobacteria bacterium]